MNPFEKEEMEDKMEKKIQHEMEKADQDVRVVRFKAYDQTHTEVLRGSVRSIQAKIRAICPTAVIIEIE